MLLKVYGTTQENRKKCRELARQIVDCKIKTDYAMFDTRQEMVDERQNILRGILELQDATGIHREVLRLRNGKLTSIAPPPDLSNDAQRTIPEMLTPRLSLSRRL